MTNETMGADAIGPSDTVNEVIQRFPPTLSVFGARGIDSCCGGSLPLETVSQRHGLDLDELIRDLSVAAGAADNSEG